MEPRDVINHLLLFASAASLATGIFAPLLTSGQFWIFKDTYSLLMGAIYPFTSGKYFIFIVIFCFSISFPVFKVFSLHQIQLAGSHDGRQKRVKRPSAGGKGSMRDVFVVAFLVMTVQIGRMGEVQIHIGLYAFAIAVILSLIATDRMHAKVEDKGEVGAET